MYPGEQFAYVVVFPADDGDGVEVVGEGVVARADVGVVGGDAVDLQQFDFFFCGHLRAVEEEGVADGVAEVVVVGDAVDDAAHVARDVFARCGLQRCVAHDFLQGGL